MTKQIFSRRRFLKEAAALVPAVGLAQGLSAKEAERTADCGPVERLILASYDVANNPASAPFSVNPLAIAEAQARVNEVLAIVRKKADLSDAAQREAVLDALDAAGSALLFVGGIALAPAAGVAIIASVAFSGTMLIARGASAPEKLSADDVLTNVAGSRVPGIIQAFEEGAVVVSGNAGTVQAVGNTARITASKIVGGAFFVYAVYAAVGSTNDYLEAAAELQKAEAALVAAQNALGDLQNQALLNDVRRACALAVAEDLEAVSINYCSLMAPGQQ